MLAFLIAMGDPRQSTRDEAGRERKEKGKQKATSLVLLSLSLCHVACR
jgi:hypothetical protein